MFPFNNKRKRIPTIALKNDQHFIQLSKSVWYNIRLKAEYCRTYRKYNQKVHKVFQIIIPDALKQITSFNR